MSWAGIANNQTVSFNNLQDAVNNGHFTALATIPVSNEQITKTDASTYVNCDTSFASFAAKASNQLVVKSNLVTTTTTTTTTLCPCVEGVLVEVLTAGTINYNLCNGTPVTNSYPIGPNVVGAGECIQRNSLVAGTATFTITSFGICCSGTGTTTTTSTTTTTTTAATTSTTTTTTTAISYDYYFVTQYLNCQQNSAPGEWLIRVPSNIGGSTWWCGDDGYQYQFYSNYGGTMFDITATATDISCFFLPC